jgi:hypothetical protein
MAVALLVPKLAKAKLSISRECDNATATPQPSQSFMARLSSWSAGRHARHARGFGSPRLQILVPERSARLGPSGRTFFLWSIAGVGAMTRGNRQLRKEANNCLQTSYVQVLNIPPRKVARVNYK